MSRLTAGASWATTHGMEAPSDQCFNFCDSLKWFIQPNELEYRWRHLGAQPAIFTLGETHFGCGSNFLHSATVWLDSAPSRARLHYVAAHSAPLTRIQLRLAIARDAVVNRQVIPLLAELLARYPVTVKGVHRLVLAHGKINLTLLFGDTCELFEQISAGVAPLYQQIPVPRVDAWFMPCTAAIGKGLGESAAALSSQGTRFAALSQSAETARQLAVYGFLSATSRASNEPTDGAFSGHYEAAAAPSIARRARQLYWHINGQVAPPSPPSQVIVLGAGIAGCCTARALATRGYDVTVVDRHPTAGSEGSGNRQAIVYPKLSLRYDYLPRINLAAMLFASRFYRPFWEAGFGAQCGVLVLPHNEKAAADQRQISVALDANANWVRLLQGRQLAAVSGLQLAAECGLYFPQLGWLPPVEICHQLLQHPNIQLQRGQVERLVHCDRDTRWSFIDSAGNPIAKAPIAVLASAFGCRLFSQTNFLPVTKVRGQISHLAVNSESKGLRTVLCGKGYLTPANNDQHSFGATYNPELDCSDVRECDHRKNIRQLTDTDAQLGKLFASANLAKLDGRANFRCTTKDYLPIVGCVPDVERMSNDFAALRHDARSPVSAAGSYLPNLYIHCGLGSRGLSYAPLSAELLACEIANELPPLERVLRLAMHPARFLIRDLKRHQR